MDKIKPFLKWAGNKYRIIDRIKALLPPGERLIEPFAGAAAVFLNTNYKENLITDTNADLINLFNLIKYDGKEFIDYCRSFFSAENNQESQYYKLRDTFNATKDQQLKAALFLYLNRHGYNGLCRYNLKGKFNTPFGQYKKPYFPEHEMKLFAQKAKTATFKVADFRQVMKNAKSGDVCYLDPPYIAISETSNFTSYSAGGFSYKDQLELAGLAKQLAKKGIPVLVSNHATEFTLNAYSSAKIERFDVRRFISCDGDNRAMVGEVLALFDAKEVSA